MDIDDSSYSRHIARAGQAGAGADQDMTEVAEILLKMNVNSARQRRYRQSTVFSNCLIDSPRFAVVHRSVKGAETSSLGHTISPQCPECDCNSPLFASTGHACMTCAAFICVADPNHVMLGICCKSRL